MPRDRKAYKKDRLIRASRKPVTQNLQEHFSGWQQLDKLPDGYSSLDDLTKAYNAAISGGMTPAEAREDLKILFNVWKRDKKTDSYILNNRIIRTELDPFTRQLIDLEAGDEAVAKGLSLDTAKGAGQAEASRQRREFTFGVPEEQARLAESNIFMPRASDATIYYHKGHLWAAADDMIPGSDDAENVWPELGDSNSLHRDKPRYHPNFMEAAGIPRGKADAYYNRKILESGAPRASGLYGQFPQQILDSLDRLIYTRAQQISAYSNKSPYDVWELATNLEFEPNLNEGFPVKSYDQAISLANEAQSLRFAGENPDRLFNQLAGTTSVGDSVQQSGPVNQVQKGIAKTEDYGKATKRIEKQRVGPTPDLSIRGGALGRTLKRGAKAISRAIPGPADAIIPGVVGGGLALAGGASLPQAAQAFSDGVVDGITGDLDGGPMANDTSYNVNGKQRFINANTNELMDKPGYGLEQLNGQWREVKRGAGVATRHQQQDLRDAAKTVSTLMPKVNQVMNPVGAGVMDFLVKPIGSAFSKVFGNRPS